MRRWPSSICHKVDNDGIVNNIGSANVIANASVSVNDTIAAYFISFMFLLDRIPAEYKYSFSKSVTNMFWRVDWR